MAKRFFRGGKNLIFRGRDGGQKRDSAKSVLPKPELMSPAGDLKAAYAALDFGADSIYLGLKKFSARAEAENFTMEELSEILAYAHSFTPKRKVYVALNTIIKEAELGEVAEILAELSDLEIDALIVQDLGVAKIAGDYFPEIRLHASTQLAVHNLEGAIAAKKLGFRRVTLARELTLKEIEDISKNCGIETEAFIHGSLCYSYSGLCLFSSAALNKSANRGECKHPCRELFSVSIGEQKPVEVLPFSMKDLALSKKVELLQKAGASSLKIEGRKKSPLYVAAVTDFYRKLLDGELSENEIEEYESGLKTVFSRQWTESCIEGPKNNNALDIRTTGHQGIEIGAVEKLVLPKKGRHKIRFKSSRALERHDGLQIELPGKERHFGFSVEFSSMAKGGSIYSSAKNSWVEILLPKSHPKIPRGAKIFCSSSQAIKRKYLPRLKNPQGLSKKRKIDVRLTLSKNELDIYAIVKARHANEEDIIVRKKAQGDYGYADKPDESKSAVRSAFSQFGNTRLEADSFEFHNPFRLFVPASHIKEIRRELSRELEKRIAEQMKRRSEFVKSQISAKKYPSCQKRGVIIKAGNLTALDMLGFEHAENVKEIIIDISGKTAGEIFSYLGLLEKIFGRQKLRLSLPPIARAWEKEGIFEKIKNLSGKGYSKWQVSNIYGFEAISCCCQKADISADWQLYVQNHMAAECLFGLGASRVSLSIENSPDELKELSSVLGDKSEVIIYQDIPLFLSEFCPIPEILEGCPKKEPCSFEGFGAKSEKLGEFLALTNNCRTTVISKKPLNLSKQIPKLEMSGAGNFRLDFSYRDYSPKDVVEALKIVSK